jgi:hypothetical protein
MNGMSGRKKDWAMLTCGLVYMYKQFALDYPENGGNKHLRNHQTCMPAYTASLPRRLECLLRHCNNLESLIF